MTDGAPHEYKEHIGSCAGCGNSPVNHLDSYCLQTLSVLLSGNAAAGTGRAAFAVFASSLSGYLEAAAYAGLAALPVSRFAHDPTAAVTYRSQVIWEEALKRGILMEQLLFCGMPTEVYRARLSKRWFYFRSLPLPRYQDAASFWIDDKYVLKQVLEKAGIPVPRAASVTNLKDAQRVFSELHAPVVVKPRSGSRGRHTTVDVRTHEALAEAFASAQRLCRYVVIEEYLEGSVCRGTVVAGKLAGFFQADAPSVTGDGTSTIGQLVTRENERKPERVQDIVLTDEHLNFLSRSGYTVDSVPESGTRVLLTHRTGRLFGGRTRELLGSEHLKLRAYLERATEATGAFVVGFDLIIGDPKRDPGEQRWGIIEANSLPYIDLHYLPLEGVPSNVAAKIWDHIEANAEQF